MTTTQHRTAGHDVTGVSGGQLVGGEALTGGEGFTSGAHRFHEATAREVAAAVAAASGALRPLRTAVVDGTMGTFLRNLALRLERAEPMLVATAAAESSGSAERLSGELARAAAVLRQFSERSIADEFIEATISHDPEAGLDLRRMNTPVGVVGVFEAGNMPFFLGVAGADAVAAWAAGCPVIVKAHPDHAATSELIARQAIAVAADVGLPLGSLSLLQGRNHAVGLDLVRAEDVSAISFTGSVNAARALSARIAERDDPIPFYGELGSTNPVFVTPAALATRHDAIAATLAAAVRTNRGQVCTKPTLVFVPDHPRDVTDNLVAALTGDLGSDEAAPLLSETVDHLFTAAVESLAAGDDVAVSGEAERGEQGWRPVVFDLDYAAFHARQDRWDELFGPAICFVRASDDQMLTAASGMPGQLTTTLFTDEEQDEPLAAALAEASAASAGRVVFNAAPTGVAVVDAMHHGGPWPAATHPGFSSVGPGSVRRFQRPVAFQNAPQQLLPLPLRDHGQRPLDSATEDA